MLPAPKRFIHDALDRNILTKKAIRSRCLRPTTTYKWLAFESAAKYRVRINDELPNLTTFPDAPDRIIPGEKFYYVHETKRKNIIRSDECYIHERGKYSKLLGVSS